MIFDILPFFAELLGTFLFISVVLFQGTPVTIGLSLIIVILLVGRLSGGHVNPAISFVMWMKNDISATKLIAYIIAQLLGGYIALILYKRRGPVGHILPF